MERKLKQYKLFRRARKKGKPIYYVCFRYSDGSWGVAQSTGSTSKQEAEYMAIEHLKKLGAQPLKPPSKLFGKVAENFFAFDGEWAKNRRRTGHKAGEALCHQRQAFIDKYAIPALGHVRLDKITDEHIEELRDSIYKDRSAATANRACSAIIEILKHYHKKKIVSFIPEFGKAARKEVKAKDVLTVEEAALVLARSNWADDRVRIMNLVASLTGMRRGELQGLQIKDVIRDEICGFIEVTKSWSNFLKRHKSTKTEENRTVIIPLSALDEIDFLISKNPYSSLGDEAFLFFSLDAGGVPISKNKIEAYSYKAIENIIGKDERKQRNVTFHSWRYYVNSFLIEDNIPTLTVQKVTGHLTKKMTEHYYKLMAKGMADVLAAQEKMAGKIMQ